MQMNIGNRIKELIENKGITPYEVSIATGVSQSTFSRLINDSSKKPNIKNAEILAKYFNVTKSWLLTGEGQINLEDSKNEITNKNGNTFMQLSDNSYSVNVKIVPFSAHARYVSEFSDPDAELFEEWETVTFIVDHTGRGNYLGFRSTGDSMNGGSIDDTPDKAIVLGRELGRQHWLDGFKPTKHGWIIITKDNMLFKDILGINVNNGTIICHSRNKSPEYCDFEYPINDILQIFKVIKRTF